MLRESIKIYFFKVQYANLRLLETHDKFLAKHCDLNKIEDMEVVTNLLYLALVFSSSKFSSGEKR